MFLVQMTQLLGMGSSPTVTFTTLPPNNSDLGYKAVTLKVKKRIAGSETVYVDVAGKSIKVFFSKWAWNHVFPVGAPNWWPFWSGTACSYNINSWNPLYVYGGNQGGFYGSTNGDPNNTEYTIYDAAAGSQDNDFTETLIDIHIHVRGIDTLEVTLAHERMHVEIARRRLPGGIWDGLPDNDGDRLPLHIEEEIGTTDSLRRTFPNFYLGGWDDEVYCEIYSQNARGTASADWANPGKNTTPSY